MSLQAIFLFYLFLFTFRISLQSRTLINYLGEIIFYKNKTVDYNFNPFLNRF